MRVVHSRAQIVIQLYAAYDTNGSCIKFDALLTVPVKAKIMTLLAVKIYLYKYLLRNLNVLKANRSIRVLT